MNDSIDETVHLAMIILMILLGMLVGLLVGEAWLITMLIGDTRWLAILAGGAVGGLGAIVHRQGQRIDALERRLTEKESASAEPAERIQPDTPAPGPSSQAAASSPEIAPLAEPAPESKIRTEPARARTASVTPGQPRQTGLAQRFARWFTHGNVPVKIGILVSLVGLAALLRHATEQGWLSFPIEARLIAVALAALGMLAVGWKQRFDRQVFALSLQGGAIGALLLTLFAAVRLYALVPAVGGFFLMAALVAGAGVLAVRQHALGLVVFALLAGFSSPLLMASDAGQPLLLFSWYAVLNFAVFGVAWFRNWPLLNRIGFITTFAVASIWGVLSWSPEHYAMAQFYLVLFFAFYFFIPVLLARRGGKPEPILVFGLPLLAFPLQIALFEAQRMPVALAAVALAGAYLISALLLRRRENCTTLFQAHALLAIGLATLAVPFAFSGPSLTVIWALEGAALVWFGCIHDRRLSRLSGLGLQIVAGCVWIINQGFHWGDPGPVLLNRLYLGGLALAAAATLSAWRYQLAGAAAWRVNLIAAAALGAWLIAGCLEIDRQFKPAQAAAAAVFLFATTALLWAWIRAHWRWALAGPVAATAMVICALLVFIQLEAGQPLAGWGGPAWLSVLIAALAADRWLAQAEDFWRRWTSLAAHLALLTALSASIGQHLLATDLLGTGWIWMAAAAPILALAAWLLTGHTTPLRMAPSDDEHHQSLAGLIIVALILGLSASLHDAGHALPLTWLPLLNPLELTQLLALLFLTAFAGPRDARLPRLPQAVPAFLLIALLTSAALRANHHLLAIDWQLDRLLAANQVQATLSVLWAILGVAAWVLGSRRRWPALWWAGAILMGVVLLKLLLIDRQFLSTVAGIVSFLAFGLLSILVGYLAPAPPNKTHDQEKKP